MGVFTSHFTLLAAVNVTRSPGVRRDMRRGSPGPSDWEDGDAWRPDRVAPRRPPEERRGHGGHSPERYRGEERGREDPGDRGRGEDPRGHGRAEDGPRDRGRWTGPASGEEEAPQEIVVDYYDRMMGPARDKYREQHMPRDARSRDPGRHGPPHQVGGLGNEKLLRSKCNGVRVHCIMLPFSFLLGQLSEKFSAL